MKITRPVTASSMLPFLLKSILERQESFCFLNTSSTIVLFSCTTKASYCCLLYRRCSVLCCSASQSRWRVGSGCWSAGIPSTKWAEQTPIFLLGSSRDHGCFGSAPTLGWLLCSIFHEYLNHAVSQEMETSCTANTAFCCYHDVKNSETSTSWYTTSKSCCTKMNI